MPRPIAYDVTHLVCRMADRAMTGAMTGIDRIDLAYGRHLAAAHDAEILGAFCGATEPHVMGGTTLRKIVWQAQRSSWEHASLETDRNFVRIKNWLDGKEPEREVAS